MQGFGLLSAAGAKDALALGPWTSYTPTLTQGVSVSLSANTSTYVQIGKIVVAFINITASSAGTASNEIQVSLPVTAANSTGSIGSFRYFDAGTAHYVGTCELVSTSVVAMYRDNSSSTLGSGGPTVASTDFIHMTIVYMAA